MEVRFYTRRNCSLCDEAQIWLNELQAEIPFRLLTIDIEQTPALRSRYGEAIPVVEAGPYTLRAPFGAKRTHSRCECAIHYNLELD